MSGYHNNYQADPVGLRETIQQLDGLAGVPTKMRTDFERTVQATSGWNGVDDDSTTRRRTRTSSRSRAAGQ
ncbi:hypothetical protein ACWV95_28740 [Streptomyces albus]